jgi:hypothetical protein
MLQQESQTESQSVEWACRLRRVNPVRLPPLATAAFVASGSAWFTPRTKHGTAALLSRAMKVARDSRFGLSTRWSYEVMSRIHR